MNEEALKYSYDLFTKDGYNGSLQDYKDLISTDKEALEYSHSLFTNDGYSGDIDNFSNLVIGENEQLDNTQEVDVLEPEIETSEDQLEPIEVEVVDAPKQQFDIYSKEGKDAVKQYGLDLRNKYNTSFETIKSDASLSLEEKKEKYKGKKEKSKEKGGKPEKKEKSKEKGGKTDKKENSKEKKEKSKEKTENAKEKKKENKETINKISNSFLELLHDYREIGRAHV